MFSDSVILDVFCLQLLLWEACRKRREQNFQLVSFVSHHVSGQLLNINIIARISIDVALFHPIRTTRIKYDKMQEHCCLYYEN